MLNESALLLLVVVTGSMSIVWAYYWQQSSDQAVRLTKLLQEAEQIRGDMYRQLQQVTRARLTEDPTELGDFTLTSEQIQRHFDSLMQLSMDEDERLAIEYMLQTYQVVSQDMAKVFEDPYQINSSARMKLLDPAYKEWMLADFESALRVFNEVLAVRQRQLEASLSRGATLAPWVVPVPVLLAVGLVLFSRAKLQRGFVLPIQGLLNGTRAFRDGDFAYRVQARGSTEIVDLTHSFNEMAEQLAASQQAMVEHERQVALGALVPVVAHNIRNPLASIRAAAQLLDQDSDAQEIADTTHGIIASVDRLERWVRALLSYLNPMEPHRAPIAVDALFEGALALLGPKLEQKRLHIDAGPAIDDVVLMVDADLLEQAMYGLLVNAADASPQNGVLRLRVQQDNDWIQIDIEDDGPGIGFVPQPTDLTPGPSTKRYGTGLGIPFAFKVLRAHGGDVEIEPCEAGGTRARLRLPAAA